MAQAQKVQMGAFETYAEELASKYEIPGFMIGLARDGQFIYENGLGYRDAGKKLPPTSDTVLGIGSVTKSFTAAAIMQLQEKGKLSVHDLVIDYLPAFKTSSEAYTKQMTIHHLLTHSSGIPPLKTLFGALKHSLDNEPTFEDEQESTEAQAAEGDEADIGIQPIETYADLMESIANDDYELLGEPGTAFSYSNDGYALLGAIIEKVSGVSYEQYINDSILKPVGMHNSAFHLEELGGHQDISSLYDEREKDGETVVFESNNPWDAPPMRPAGFLKSTVSDMLKYAEIYRNQGKVGSTQLLSSESVEAMMTPHIKCAGDTYYGYGLMVTPDCFGYKLVEHGGSIKGVAAQLNILPELGITGFANANLSGAPTTRLLHGAFASYLGEPVTASHVSYEEKELAEETLQEYEGVYASAEGQSFTVEAADGTIALKLPGMNLTEVKPIGNDSFLVHFREDDMVLNFVRNEDEKVIRLAFGFRQISKVK